MDYLQKLITDIELHSVKGIKECFTNGVNPNDKFRDQPLIYELISEYTRSPRFKDCVKAFVDHGLEFDDEALLAVLLDDAESLNSQLIKDPSVKNKQYNLRSAYTPLENVTLLHICAEFNHVACAKMLVDYGADINARAGLDEYGFGGQTPIFHTVNQNQHNSADMFDFLLAVDAEILITLKGIVWGKGYEWETLMPAVNPISYAMMGLLPQVHREEETIAIVVSGLLKKGYGIDYELKNIPNVYLRK